MVSGDRDLLQLATEKILVRIPKTRGGKTVIEDYHAAQVQETFQVTPPQIIELKALMEIPRTIFPVFPGWGRRPPQKSSAPTDPLKMPTIIWRRSSPTKPGNLCGSITIWRCSAKKLATIDTDAAIDFSWEEARLGNLYTPEAYEMFRRLDFKNLLSRFDQEQQPQAMEYQVITDPQKAGELFRQAQAASGCGLALLEGSEGTVGLGLAFGRDQVYYFPVGEAISDQQLKDWARQLFAGEHPVGAPDVKAMRKWVEIPADGQAFDLGVAAIF